jgi:LysR family transcriptional regulator, regulator for genes of the gallate degradation pathway
VNVRDFLDVRVICEMGSLRKAATVLGVTQPTLSNRIAHLEDQLGAPLFDRSRGHSQPTDLALFIARRAATMADEAGRLAEEAKRLASGKGGLVRIGVSPVPSRIMFPDIVISIANQFPNISLDVLSAPTSQLAEGLIERELDMIVCPALDGDHPEITSELLLETDIIVVARPGHPLCTDPPATIAGLFKYPIALPVTEKHYLDTVKREHGIDIENLPGRILCSDPSMLARIVQKSERLFAAAPRFYFSPEIEAGLLCIVATPVPMGHSLYLHWNRDAFPLPALQRAREAIRNGFASL